jgi:drug/metabolite transporter (DMT)-like permease
VLMQPRHLAIFALVGVMIIWGSTFVVTKASIEALPPMTLAFVRVLIGTCVLLPFAAPRMRRGEPLPWRRLFALGVVGVAVYYVAFNGSLALTTAAQGALVQSSIPAVTACMAMIFLRERAGRGRLFGIALSVAGVLVVFADDSRSDSGSATLLGQLLMFGSVVCWGLYTAMAKRVAHCDAIVVTTCITGIGTLLLLPIAVVELVSQPLPNPDFDAWLGAAYLGVFASGLGYLLYNFALQHLAASTVGVYTNLIPIVGVLTGVVALHEPLSWQAIVGGTIVMIGVAITTFAKSDDA